MRDSWKPDRAGEMPMNTTIQANRTWSTTHRISAEDKTAMSAMRVIVEPNKGRLQGTAARTPFDAIMERVASPPGGAGPKVRVPNRQSFICTEDGLTGGRRRPSETWLGISPLVRASRRLYPIIDWLRNIPFPPRSRMRVAVIWGLSSEDSQRWQLQETRPEAI